MTRRQAELGKAAAASGEQRGSFVIQEHHARSLHWDFRLEKDGVLVSWAVPKGLPPERGVNHLAVHVEDHPMEYGSFSGTIPDHEYGAGTVTIWDKGSYESSEWTDESVKVTLHGSRVEGRYGLFHTDGDNWMIHRIDPAPAGFEPLPALVRPMLATASSELPTPTRTGPMSTSGTVCAPWSTSTAAGPRPVAKRP